MHRRSLAAVFVFLLLAGSARAQDLEPRAYVPVPTGANLVLVAYAHSKGEVVFDPSVPITDVKAGIHSSLFLYGRTFGFFGRAASAAVQLPYVWGHVSGNIDTPDLAEFREVDRSGLGDVRFRFTTNLLGGPALARPEFAKRRPRRTLGASLVVVAPSGQYTPVRLINTGTNRWSFKPEIGFSAPRGSWLGEIYAGCWIFRDNDDFFPGGVHREQEPMLALQAHVSRTFKPRLWLAGDATFYTGGRTTVNGATKADLQRNTRLGLTLSVPAGKRGSVKVSWARGVIVRIGGNFDTLAAGYQLTWF